MKKVIQFSRTVENKVDPHVAAVKDIEERFGMSFWEYMGFSGDKEQVRAKIERVLHKETLQMATKIAEDGRRIDPQLRSESSSKET